jgi:hypothetical protein
LTSRREKINKKGLKVGLGCQGYQVEMTWATRVEIETVLRISAAAFLNLNQRFRFKSNAFWNLNKFKYFSQK